LTDPSDARELLEFPDLDRFNSVESAGRDLVEKTIAEALRGKSVTAHPLMPLDYAIRKGTLEHDLAELQGAPESALQRLRDFIAFAESLGAEAEEAAANTAAAQQPAGPAMPGGPMPPGMPPGGPMPPPDQMGIAS
jgi:hypothetical protein